MQKETGEDGSRSASDGFPHDPASARRIEKDAFQEGWRASASTQPGSALVNSG